MGIVLFLFINLFILGLLFMKITGFRFQAPFARNRFRKEIWISFTQAIVFSVLIKWAFFS